MNTKLVEEFIYDVYKNKKKNITEETKVSKTKELVAKLVEPRSGK